MLSLAFSACGKGTESTPAASIPVAAAATSENVEQVLSKVEQDWTDALVKGDAAFQERILADDYRGVGPDGRISNKAQSVDEIRSGQFKAESMSISGVTVRVFGEVAVVTYSQTEKSQTQGKDSSGLSLWTDIFVKRNGTWQIAANHGSRVAETKKVTTRRSGSKSHAKHEVSR
jgi:hypothetical protein